MKGACLMVSKRSRQEKIIELVEAKEIRSQQQLLRELARVGIAVNQSSISRDLADLGMLKLEGVYRLPMVSRGESRLVDMLEVDTAGDHLIVVKTAIGQASMAGVAIDRAKIPEVVGTIAGDDSVFVAVKGRAQQIRAIKRIVDLFKFEPRRRD